MKDVYAIFDFKTEGRERARWVRVGVAFDNKDGSLNLLLDALPLSGRLQVRARPVEAEGDSASQPAAERDPASR